MTRLELANQLIEGQPAFHFAFIPMVHLRVERFELITCADFKSAASAGWATRAYVVPAEGFEPTLSSF